MLYEIRRAGREIIWRVVLGLSLTACGQEGHQGPTGPEPLNLTDDDAYAASPRSELASIRRFHQVDGRLFRGARPPTRKSLRDVAALGITTVISLETYALEPHQQKAEKAWAEAAGMRWIWLPMSPLPSSPPRLEDVYKALDYIGQSDKVLVHCIRGKDRTGVVVGAARIKFDGWTAEEAIAEMKAMGHNEKVFPGWTDLLYRITEDAPLK